MRQYNSTEATLKAWRRKLARVQGSQDLLAIIDSGEETNTRFDQFNEKKAALLDEIEAQEWPWTSLFSWLWSWISAILPASWRSQTVPGLKEILEGEGVVIDTFEVSEENIPTTAAPVLLDDISYEEALFTEPQSALADLKHRIDNLDKSSDIDNIIERLYAIKYRLRADTYQTLLTKLFRQHPVKTLNFCYARYTENPQEMPRPHDFIEHELMSQKLMDIFVLPHSADSNSRLYALHELLLVLSLSKRSDPEPPLKTLLNEAALANKRPSTLCSELSKRYTKDVKSQIIDLLPERVKSSGLKMPNHGVARSAPFALPLNLLRTVVANPKSFEQNSFQVQPLYRNIARLASQELLLSYHQIPEMRKNSQFLDTIDFLNNEILGTNKEAKKERDRLKIPFTISECEAILSPFPHKARVPSEYEHAVYYTNQLVVASFFATSILDLKNKIIEKSLKYAASIHGNREQATPIPPHELSWILSVVERLVPNEIEISQRVKYIFTEIKFYDLSDFEALPKTQSNQSTKELIAQIIDDLTNAKEAFKELDAVLESDAIEKVMIALNDLLVNRAVSSSEQLQSLYNDIFIPLKSQYLTEQLSHRIHTTLTNMHGQFTLWNLENIADQAETSIMVSGHLLEMAEQKLTSAGRANSLGNFAQEIDDSKKAVYYFSLYLDQLKPEEQSASSLSQARNFLEQQLKPYLKPELALSWRNKIEQFKRTCCHMPSTMVSSAAQGGIFANKGEITTGSKATQEINHRL